ncbi:hypothetical protein ALC57_16598 [Trachymyrmex cornetzi]|uniref:Uncharacterized protein n=1 Tax=Trachymyrmex cornetzi TaxID=471704 RepID=A0A151IUU5_9HYME|nr:hypothetical protein ALC57_16598 [Trachymyrmex cornetzi]
MADEDGAIPTALNPFTVTKFSPTSDIPCIHKVSMISLARLATLENRQAVARAFPTTVSLFSLETYGENLKYEMMVEARMDAVHKVEVEKLLYAALVSADTTLSASLSHSPLSPMRRFRIVEYARLASVKGCTTVQKRGVATGIKKMASPLKRESPAVIFTGAPRNNRETAKFSKFDLSPIIPHSSSRCDASRVCPTEREGSENGKVFAAILG